MGMRTISFTAPELTPKELAERFDGILATAIRLIRQMPDDRLEDELPTRNDMRGLPLIEKVWDEA